MPAQRKQEEGELRVTEMDGGAAGKKCKREENNCSIEVNLRQWECEMNPILRPFKAISEVCFDR